MSKNEVVAISAEDRQKAYNAMTKAGRELADGLVELVRKGQTGTVRVAHTMGCRLVEAFKTKNESTYGTAYADQLAVFMSLDGGTTTLYALQNFAKTFTREFVDEWSNKQMSNGKYMDTAHWLRLAQIDDKEQQQRMLERVVEEGLSSRNLEREIRGGTAGKTKNTRQGGRNPQIPSSPVGGLQKAFEITKKLNRYEVLMAKHVFDKIDSMEPDKVNASVKERIEACLVEANKAKERIGDMVDRLEGNLKRVDKVLASKKEEAKAAKKDKGSSNGQAEDGKKKKKKKKKARQQQEPVEA